MTITKINRHIIFFAIICNTSILFAQQKDVKPISLWGHALDSFTKAGVSAKITLMNSDSIVLDSTMCDNQGNDATYRFHIPRKPEKYIIKAEHKDFETEFVNFDINRIARNNYFDAPWHYMKRKSRGAVDREMALGEIVVKATKVRMAYKGDTIVFNADAFNVPDGSMLSSLIKQLPNTEINSQGEIFVNGRKIDELMLNGDSFYKGNNKVMLDNLPYYVVKDIRVFERSTEKSAWIGKDIEKKDYVMNVQMKKEYMGRFFGNAEGAGGTKDRYLGRLFGMNITNHSRFTAFGNVNNINDFRRPGEDGTWSDNWNSDGIIKRKEANVSYLMNDKDKRYSENLESSLLMQDNDERSFGFTRNYLDNACNYSMFRSNVLRKNVNLNVANTFKMQHPFKPYRFTSYMKLSYSTQKYDYQSKGAMMDDDPSVMGSLSDMLDSIHAMPTIAITDKHITYRSATNSRMKYKDLTLSGNMNYSRKLKNGDNISFEMNGHYTRKNPNEEFNRFNKTTFSGKADDNCNRYLDMEQRDYAYHANLTYSIVLKGWTCKPSFSYHQSYGNCLNYNYRLDWLLNGWDDMDIYDIEALPSTKDSLMLSRDQANSYNYRLMHRAYNGKLSFYKYVKSGNVSNENDLQLGVHNNHDKLTYRGYELDTIAKRSNWLLDANYRYERKWDNSNKTFTLSMGYNMREPDFTKLVGETNASNPTYIEYKNAGLKKTESCNLDLRFVTRKKSINQNMYVSGHVDMKRNDTSTRTVYDTEKSVYHYTPMNVNGNWQADVSYGLNRDLDKAKHFYASSRTTLSYIHNVGYAMAYDWDTDMLCKINTGKLDQRLSLTYTLGQFSATLNGRVDWRYSVGNLSSFNTLNRIRFNYGGQVVYTTPFGMNISTDVNVINRRGYEDPAMNNNEFICNASVSYSFTRKKNVTVMLDAYDIFHGIDTRYELFSGTSKMEVWLNNIPSYYMAHLVVKF